VKSAKFSNTKDMVHVRFHWILKSKKRFRRILCEKPQRYGGYLKAKVGNVVPADATGGGGGGGVFPPPPTFFFFQNIFFKPPQKLLKKF